MSIGDAIFDHVVRPLRLRGKYRLLSGLLPSHGEKDAQVCGYRMALDLGDLVQRGVYLGSYEFNETRWVRQLLKPGDVAIDVGANCGYYTALFSQIVGPQGNVIALEPNPSLAGKLKRFIESNQITNVTLIEAGASDIEEIAILRIPPKSQGNESATMACVEDWDAVQVSIRRLDDIFPAHSDRPVALLKIDIEGHEFRALRGFEQAIRSGRVKYLLTEINGYWLERQGTSAAQFMDYCAELGFRRNPLCGNSTESVLLEWFAQG